MPGWYHSTSLAPNDCASLESWVVGASLVLPSKQELKNRGGEEFLLLSKTSSFFPVAKASVI